MTSVAIVMPIDAGSIALRESVAERVPEQYRPENPHTARSRAYEYVRDYLVEGTAALGWSGPWLGTPRSSTWVKAEAVDSAIHVAGLAEPDVLVVHDADSLVDLVELQRCVEHVGAHGGWAVPHRLVYRLTRATTEYLYAEGTLALATPKLERHPYVGFEGGGVTVVAADVYRDVPLDPRFAGWGGEDIAWGRALRLLVGAPYRGDAPLWHLWHEHPSPESHRPQRVESQLLLRAYRTKRVDRMRALVDRARVLD